MFMGEILSSHDEEEKKQEEESKEPVINSDIS